MPMPLSRTPKRNPRPSRVAEYTDIRFLLRRLENFIALATRLKQLPEICTGSARTVGSGPWVTLAPQ